MPDGVQYSEDMPNHEYPDGIPDGVQYLEDMPDDGYQVTKANINIFEPRPAHSIQINKGNNKRKRESGIMLDYERVSTTKRNQVDCQ